MTVNLHLKICQLRIGLLLFIIIIFKHFQQNYIKRIIIYLEQFFGELFTRINNGNYLRSKSDFIIPQIRTVLKGSIFWSNYLELNHRRTKEHYFFDHFQKMN